MMNRTNIMDAINGAYVELENRPDDLKRVVTTLSQNVWSLQYGDPNDRVFAMFLTLWCNDIVRNFGDHAQDCSDEDRESLGHKVHDVLKEVFFLDYAIQTGRRPMEVRDAYFHAMRRLTDVYVEAIVRSNVRAACCF